jgi:hypothetical protein
MHVSRVDHEPHETILRIYVSVIVCIGLFCKWRTRLVSTIHGVYHQLIGKSKGARLASRTLHKTH